MRWGWRTPPGARRHPSILPFLRSVPRKLVISRFPHLSELTSGDHPLIPLVSFVTSGTTRGRIRVARVLTRLVSWSLVLVLVMEAGDIHRRVDIVLLLTVISDPHNRRPPTRTRCHHPALSSIPIPPQLSNRPQTSPQPPPPILPNRPQPPPHSPQIPKRSFPNPRRIPRHRRCPRHRSTRQFLVLGSAFGAEPTAVVDAEDEGGKGNEADKGEGDGVGCCWGWHMGLH